MELWRFLMPSTIGFTIRSGGHLLYDWITGAPPLPLRVRDYVAAESTAGDPASVLEAMDRFAEQRFLMNIGPEKGPLVRELIARLPANARILELGLFCGYSSILLASTLGPEGRITSVEKSSTSVTGARANIAHAGLSERIQIVHGGSSETIPTLEGPFDLVFLDHWKDLYRTDLQLIEEHSLLRPGSIVVADNVGEVFGAAAYLDYVRTCGRYDSEHRTAKIEYTQIPDAVEISVYRGPTAVPPK